MIEQHICFLTTLHSSSCIVRHASHELNNWKIILVCSVEACIHHWRYLMSRRCTVGEHGREQSGKRDCKHLNVAAHLEVLKYRIVRYITDLQICINIVSTQFWPI
jgi:hypothetical protein